jgi:hypothetical protein
MVAINFDQASKGQVSSTETALSIANTGVARALEARLAQILPPL